MGVACFIVLDNKTSGFDTSVNGKAVAREIRAVEQITKKLNLPDINDLTSFAALAVREHVATAPRSVKDAAALLADLERFEEVLDV